MRFRIRRPNLRAYRVPLLVGSGLLGIGIGLLAGAGLDSIAFILIWVFIFWLLWIDV